MSLVKKLLVLGSAALISFSGGRAEAQTIDCQEVEERHRTKLEGRIFGFFDGCLDEFVPKKFNEQSYLESFNCLDDFLKESELCPMTELKWKVSNAMLLNLFSKNETVSGLARSRLKQLGVLDFKKQIEDLVTAAEVVKKRIRDVPDGLEARKEHRKEVEMWKSYLKDLRVHAVMALDQAILFRERPPGEFVWNESLFKGLKLSYQAYQSSMNLQVSLGNADWGTSYRIFKQWKKDNETMMAQLIKVENSALNFAKKEMSGKWVKIVNGDKSIWASKNFSQEWGENGENYFSLIERIDEVSSLTEIIPLKVGNKWKYDVFLYGRKVEEVSTAVKCTRNGYFLYGREVVKNTGEGLVSVGRSNNCKSLKKGDIEERGCLEWRKTYAGKVSTGKACVRSKPGLLYRYPGKVGEVYDNGKSFSKIVSVAGVFGDRKGCYVYEEGVGKGGPFDCPVTICPGLGLVKSSCVDKKSVLKSTNVR